MGRTRGKEERSGERSGRWTCRVGFCSLTDAIRQWRPRYWSSNQISTSATVVDGPAQGSRGSMAGVTLASRPLLLPLRVCGSGGGMVQTGGLVWDFGQENASTPVCQSLLSYSGAFSSVLLFPLAPRESWSSGLSPFLLRLLSSSSCPLAREKSQPTSPLLLAQILPTEAGIPQSRRAFALIA